ncbi:MAG: carbohydrate ABC transporter permease [bacterium]|nr:carbohydrate ABC transporter permease [bacterium]
MRKTAVYLLLIVLLFFCVIPFYLMLINMTRTNDEINRGISLLPGTALINNFQNLVLGRKDNVSGLRWGALNIGRGFINSLLVAASATILSAYFSALTAYGFAVYRFYGKKILFGVILTVIMIPNTVSLIGIYKLITGLGMQDTYWPLILPAIASPFSVYFLRQYIISVMPYPLIEAARIDGAGELKIFHQIMLPLLVPGIATVSIFFFLASWNSYLLPLTVLNSQELYTLPLLIQQLNTTTFNRDLGTLYAGVAVSVIPIIIAFVFLSRYIIQGLAEGSIKE